MWFEDLVGFREESPEQVRDALVVEGETLSSSINGLKFQCGRLETPSLAELRRRVPGANSAAGRLRVSQVVADVQALHADPDNAGAFFQVASQFNLLEMVSPAITPEHGVSIYARDRTQGPACAIACGAGTIYRNYFVVVNGRTGQSKDSQIDCLEDLGRALGNRDSLLWVMQNGYVMATPDGLDAVTRQLESANEAETDRLRGLLRIGVQSNTQVTLPGCSPSHTVSQGYCSALPVAYSGLEPQRWSRFGSLVLEAAYEAALCAGILNRIETGNDRIYLTQLGGGAFGNPKNWILAAIRRALTACSGYPLDVRIVSHGAASPAVGELVAGFPTAGR